VERRKHCGKCKVRARKGHTDWGLTVKINGEVWIREIQNFVTNIGEERTTEESQGNKKGPAFAVKWIQDKERGE